MNLDERLERRRNTVSSEDLITDWQNLDPRTHLAEPVGRGSVIEKILDTLEPIFDDQLPSNMVIWGPPGTGKSAILVALFTKLSAEHTNTQPNLYTTTRGGDTHQRIRFVYVNGRYSSSLHKFYYRVLRHLTHESIPERGIGTDALQNRIKQELVGTPGAVVVIDHADEEFGLDQEILDQIFETLTNATIITVGQTDPEPIATRKMTAKVRLEPYHRHELIDLLTVRANRSLATGVTHEQARSIADWAEGNAHDALVALFNATMAAHDANHSHIHSSDIKLGINQSPKNGIPMDRLFSLSDNKQEVLGQFLQLLENERGTIQAAAGSIADNSSLTKTTVRRFLYEMANQSYVKKVQVKMTSSSGGRQATRLEPQFSTTAFEKLRMLHRGNHEFPS